MIITVSGWRDFADEGFVVEHCYRVCGGNPWQPGLFWRVGCARGVDEFLRSLMLRQQVPSSHWTVYRADWDAHGKAAGPIRNGLMLRGEGNSRDPNPGVVTDRLLSFPRPGSNWWRVGSGSGDCVMKAWKLGVDLDIPGYRE